MGGPHGDDGKKHEKREGIASARNRRQLRWLWRALRERGIGAIPGSPPPNQPPAPDPPGDKA
jgi:hypothetical protein